MKVYLVGGAVRDKLLGLPIKERDWVVVGATPEELLAKGYRRLDSVFPVFVHPDTGEEYALARRETKVAPGHKGFRIEAGPDVTLEEDLRRRDLTINAIAQTEEGCFVDPFDGRRDLEEGLLRRVTPAFVEDPLRVLRTARFAARFARWGFRVAHGTHSLMKRMVENGEVATLTAERVWQQTERALAEDRPSRYFEVLHRCGALAVLIPELDRALGVSVAHEQTSKNTTAGPLQALAAAAELSPDPVVRYAALMQGMVVSLSQPGKTVCYDVDAVAKRLRAPRAYRDLALLACMHYDLVKHTENTNAPDLLAGMEALDAFRRPRRFAQFLTVCTAIARGRMNCTKSGIPRLRAAYTAANNVDTRDVADRGLEGTRFGSELRRLRTEAITSVLSAPKL